MANRLSKEQKVLYKRVDEILWKDWDPIGVNDCLEARDEYQGYLPHVYRLALDGRDVYKISSHLNELIKTSMGMSSDEDLCLKAAKLIVQSRDKILV